MEQATASVFNSVIAQNTSSTAGSDVYGVITSLGNNVIGDATGSSGFGAAGDQTGTSGVPLSPVAIAKVSPAAGTPAGGTTVTITGLNLFGATAVYFGTTPAEYFEVYVNNGVNAGAEVIAVPPPGTGTVDIVVDTAAGDSVISQLDQFTYVAAPTISGVSPASGPVAGGTTVTITGTGFTGATAVYFGTNRATNFAINPAGTQITATSPAAAGTVNITVATAGGTSALVIADHFTYIAAAPVVVTPSNWTPAGLTLALDGGGNLHVYQIGHDDRCGRAEPTRVRDGHRGHLSRQQLSQSDH